LRRAAFPFATALDSAAMESFFSPLKTERIERIKPRTRQSKLDYIERFYNVTRRHSTIGPQPCWVRAQGGINLTMCPSNRQQRRPLFCVLPLNPTRGRQNP
jgi:hypothetical protein